MFEVKIYVFFYKNIRVGHKLSYLPEATHTNCVPFENNNLTLLILKSFDVIRLIMCLIFLKLCAFKTIFYLNYSMLKSLDIIISIMCLIIFNYFFKTIFH